MTKSEIHKKLTVLWYEYETTTDVNIKEDLMIEIDILTELKNKLKL